MKIKSPFLVGTSVNQLKKYFVETPFVVLYASALKVGIGLAVGMFIYPPLPESINHKEFAFALLGL